MRVLEEQKIYHVGNQVQSSKEKILLKRRAQNRECFQGILPDQGLYDPVKPGSQSETWEKLFLKNK